MLQAYENRAALMAGLAREVAGEIEAAIDARGRASLALPGGTTPAPFLKALSAYALPWEKVNVMLGDERFVDETSARSNTRLLKENFLQNEAARAHFVPLIVSQESAEASAQAATRGVEEILPLDVLVVGMGEDMHTASLFPDSPDLPAALEDDAPALVVIRAENAGEPRISLSAKVLRAARHKHVLITGEEKKRAYEKALGATTEREAPIRAVIASEPPARVHFAD